MGLMNLNGIMKEKVAPDAYSAQGPSAPTVPSLFKKKPKVASAPLPSLMKRLTGK